MEYCEGGSIADIMSKIKKPLNEDQIALICEATLRGLDYLHASGKIHRDIKPDNILLNSKGESKLGILYVVDMRLTCVLIFRYYYYYGNFNFYS